MNEARSTGAGVVGMMMEGALLKRTAIIELRRDRVSIVVPSATAPWTGTRAVDPSLVSSAWSEGLSPLDEVLHDLVTEAGVRGGTARLVYASRDASVGLCSVPLRMKHAERAARLALSESTGYEMPEMFAPVVPIAVDKPSSKRRSHWLLSGDRGESLESAASWLSRAGVRAEALLPAQAVAMSRALTEAMALDGEGGGGSPTVVLRLGFGEGVLVGVHGGRILFGRALSLDLHEMIEALCRPIYPLDAPSDPESSIQGTVLSRSSAYAALFDGGVRGGDEAVREAQGLTRNDLRVVLQPVIQRLVVETRQTLRFGLAESKADGGDAALFVTGAGASVPELADVLGYQLKLDARRGGRNSGYREDEPTCADALLDAAHLRNLPRLNLLSGDGARRMARRRLNATAAAGIALAMCVGGIDYLSTRHAAVELERGASAFSEVVKKADALHAERVELGAAIAKAQKVRSNIASELSPHVPAGDLLREVASRLPDSARLLEVAFSAVDGRPTAVVRVIVTDASEGGGVSSIATALEASALILSAELGGTTSAAAQEAGALEAELRLELPSIPPASVLTLVEEGVE